MMHLHQEYTVGPKKPTGAAMICTQITARNEFPDNSFFSIITLDMGGTPTYNYGALKGKTRSARRAAAHSRMTRHACLDLHKDVLPWRFGCHNTLTRPRSRATRNFAEG